MWALIKRFFKDILTESSNEYDVTRVAFLLLTLSYIAMSIYDVISQHRIDYISWSTGAAALLAAGGASVGVRAKLEDKQDTRDILKDNDNG